MEKCNHMVFFNKRLVHLTIILVSLSFLSACEKPEIRGYFFSQNKEKQQPYIYCGVRNDPGSHSIAIPLPCALPGTVVITSDPPMFSAEQYSLNQKCELVVAIEEKIWDFTVETPIRPIIREAYENFLIGLENAGLQPEAIHMVKAGIAAAMPMTFDEVLYYHYGFDPANSYMDLLPGMRLRIDYQIYQTVYSSGSDGDKLSGFVGNGTSYSEVVSYRHGKFSGRNLIGLEPFLIRIENPKIVGSVEKGGGGVIDLHQPGYQKPYYRLFYPNRIPRSDSFGSVGTAQNVTLIAADTLTALGKATEKYLLNQTIEPETDVAVFYFRGRAAVIPEIAVLVNGHPVYAPVGTTVRQLLDRYILTTRPEADKGIERLRYSRNHGHITRFGQKEYDFPSFPQVFFMDRDPTDHIVFPRYWNGSDSFDVPVTKGDRLDFE